MGSVEEAETASAAGLMNFVRTISGAFATSLVTTFWQDISCIAHDRLSSILNPGGQATTLISGAPALTGQMAREMINMMVTGESLMLATNKLMIVIAIIFSSLRLQLFSHPSRIALSMRSPSVTRN